MRQRLQQTFGLIAFIKVAGSLVLLAIVRFTDRSPSVRNDPTVLMLMLVVFSLTAVWLWAGARSDTRAKDLSVVFLLIAAAFAEGLLTPLYRQIGTASSLVRFSTSVRPEAFVPYFILEFVVDFPRAKNRLMSGLRRIFRWLVLAISALLFALTVANGICRCTAGTALGRFVAQNILNPPDRSYFWIVLTLLIVVTLAISIWKTRIASSEEERRARYFGIGVALGSAPLLLDVLVRRLVGSPLSTSQPTQTNPLESVLIYSGLASIPITTAYAVLVHHVMDVRFIVRKALQYAFARYSLVVLMMSPVFLLVRHLYLHRNDTIVNTLSGGDAVVLLAMTLSTAAIFVWREPAFATVDRHFFREQYEADRILSKLMTNVTSVSSESEVSGLLERELDRALHLEHISILFLNEDTQLFESMTRSSPSFTLSSTLLERLTSATAHEPFDFDARELPAFAGVDRASTQWLVDSGTSLLVPMLSSTGTVIGLIALGSKKSELPFSVDDRRLLKAVASSAAMALDNRMIRRKNGVALASGNAAENARLCPSCERVLSHTTELCANCNAVTIEAGVPVNLFGKFRFQRVVGRGGMGVVYEATDIALQRSVAIKTLPEVSLEQALRLRREARAMAKVEHPNLAGIFGAESWKGTPMLVEEFLAAGTLADLLSTTRVPIPRILDIGIALADALIYLHSVGMLHRDIKPSNIGFTVSQIPKLMDFGLVKEFNELRRDLPEVRTREIRSPDTALDGDPEPDAASTALTGSGVLLGTPAYLPPEALDSREATPAFDLWALNLTLFECVAGVNPFSTKDVLETLKKVQLAKLPDLKSVRIDVPPSLQEFFHKTLARNPKERPATAKELRRELEHVRIYAKSVARIGS